MNTSGRRGTFAWPIVISVLLHLALIGVVVVASWLRAPVLEEAPVAVELWSRTSRTRVIPALKPPAAVTRLPRVAPVTAAQVNLGHDKLLAMRKEASRPRFIKVEPPPKVSLADVKRSPAVAVKADVAKQALLSKKHPSSNKGVKAAAQYDTDDLLADLMKGIDSHRQASASRTQAGTNGGNVTGAAQGSKAAYGGYAASVQAKVKPLVQLPPDINGNPKAVVLVTLLPTLEVRNVVLLSSSGNQAYDEAVQRALWEVKTFPPLPLGAGFSDYRQLKLEFRPR